MPANIWKDESINFRNLRSIEKEIAEHIVEGKDSHSYVAIYDLRPVVKREAILGLITTVVVMFLLAVSSMAFSS